MGLDLNRDGRIGGPGLTDQVEKSTHIDFNRDGLVGAHRPPAGGGQYKGNLFLEKYILFFTNRSSR